MKALTTPLLYVSIFFLPTGAPGSTTKTEYEAIKAPSSAGCSRASALGSKERAWAKGPPNCFRFSAVTFAPQIGSSQSSVIMNKKHHKDE